MRRPNWMFVFILVITILAIVINLAQPYNFRIGSSEQKFAGIPLSQALKSIGIQRDFSLRKGLDLEGGTSITLKADMKGIPTSQRDNALDSAKTVIERRVNFFGVSEPIVQTSKVNQEYRIITEIPGITDVNQAVRLIGTTAKLTFWEQGEASISAETATSSALPLGVVQLLGPGARKTNLTGADLQSAVVSFDPNSGKPQVDITFTGEGGKKFGEITKRNVGKLLAIVLDNQLVDAPRVLGPIYGGKGSITGNYTTEEAKSLQIQLNAGALPVSLSVLEQRAIGATLGEASLQKSLIAGLLGFLVIVIFMVTLYGRLGVIASVALLLYTLILLTLFRLIPVTLTLAGIAGLILSIGMAVDANILIFERMKEEIRRGRSLEMAINLGFSRAWLSIRDSNVASLITSAILYYFGTGMIKGFAFTLALGVLVSMFSAIVVTRTLLQIFYRKS